MKRLVNQKLSDFNIKGALQTLSGNSSFAKPNEESLNTLQQKHPHPQMLTPHQFASVQPKYVLQSLPSLMVERLHLHHSRQCQHFSPHQA